ncbi:MAG: helix-turn-helix transcriptional regulator, partial [Novosphingobium sp.]|uniref:response regulator transcription factor n=1 Tax=Novosphingobium sp. TaxID=1874826 RepID=UPI0032BDDBDF
VGHHSKSLWSRKKFDQIMDLLPVLAQAIMPPKMADEVKQSALLDRLTPKQREVLGHVSEGLTSKEIGRKLAISESAVNQRIETIRQRLGGMPRAQIGRIYRRQNTLLVTLPTSNSLTGKPIHLQIEGEAEQPFAAEGTVDPSGPGFNETSGVLQPSTFSSPWNGPGAVWLRLGMIVAIAFGLAATIVLLLDATEKFARMIGAEACSRC